MQDVPGDGAAAEPSAALSGRKRPRIDIKALGVGTGERKRGKSMFGVLLNTLNKAKAEDKERNASEAVCSSYLRWLKDMHTNDASLGRPKRGN